MLPSWLTKLGFHLLYNQMAWTYDTVAWSVSFGQWADWRRMALKFLQPGPTLELAYGTGGLFADMLETGFHPVGIDASSYMAKLAARRLRRRRLKMRLSQAEAQQLPFPSNYFANVVATFPTNYIFEPKTLTEIERVLRSPQHGNEAGRLIIVMEGRLQGPWPIRPFIDWLYTITNQRDFASRKVLPVFAKYGLNARWKMVDADGIAVRMLIAEKFNQSVDEPDLC